jgi:hypothetical protein
MTLEAAIEKGFKADFEVGGGWGNAIDWTNEEQFVATPLHPDARYRCYGFKWKKPEKGQTLLAEFNNSWMVFEFVDVTPSGDPKDMFFATVKPIQQFTKQ